MRNDRIFVKCQELAQATPVGIIANLDLNVGRPRYNTFATGSRNQKIASSSYRVCIREAGSVF
jgi:hypothetical protein